MLLRTIIKQFITAIKYKEKVVDTECLLPKSHIKQFITVCLSAKTKVVSAQFGWYDVLCANDVVVDNTTVAVENEAGNNYQVNDKVKNCLEVTEATTASLTNNFTMTKSKYVIKMTKLQITEKLLAILSL